MRCLIGSMFRDSTGYLIQYFAQQELLAQLLEERGDTVRWVFCENESVDHTYASLTRWGAGRDVVVRTFADGSPYYSSRDIPERWAHLADVANVVLNEIRPVDDVFVWIEADLLFDPQVIVDLVDALDDDRPIVAPLLLGMRGTFYDTWGTSVGGTKFKSSAPFHRCMGSGEWVNADSSGGVVVAYARVAEQARYTPQEGYVGYARTLVAKGFPWALNLTKAVYHS